MKEYRINNGGQVASGVLRLHHAVSVGIIPMRALTNFSGHIYRTQALLLHLRPLRLSPVVLPLSLRFIAFWCVHWNWLFICDKKFTEYVSGSWWTNAILSAEYYCCYRPNPILQILYLTIVGATYYFTVQSSFAYFPSSYLGIQASWELLFLLTSFSDPGTVKAENVSQYLSAYPYDNIIYSEKECATCRIPKPARSKHCSICDHCVVCFDHNCRWMNNCIGERNTRFFMAFLIWHFILCVYGMVAIVLVLAGRLKELRVIHILTLYDDVESSFRGLAPHAAQWLLSSYNTQILLVVLLVAVSLLMVGFFGYHVKLCFINTTTNETFKWQDYMSLQRKVNEVKASAAALKAGINGLRHESRTPGSKWKSFFRRSPLKDAEVVVRNNIYDKGVIHNLCEVIFPFSSRSSFLQLKSKSL
ncbi:hypothetical protein Ancab_000798 [Ancistrocladus abbreviatus]